ncbi:ribonuclease HI, partial [Kitasatospora sp. NPDC056531]
RASAAKAPKARSTRPAAASGTGSTTKRTGSRTLNARFPGTCPCSRPYAKGDKITKVGSSWGHPECAAAHA